MGLEKILDSIGLEAAENEKIIISAANENAEKIIEKASLEAAENYEKIIKAAERECENNILSAENMNVSLKNKAILEAKVEAVYEMLSELKNSILSMPKNDYFGFIKHLILKYAKDENGILIFGEEDKKKLSENFIDEVNSQLAFPVILSEGIADFKNGFILKYGDIEENCNIDALLLEKQDVLKDKIAKTLFGEEF